MVRAIKNALFILICAVGLGLTVKGELSLGPIYNKSPLTLSSGWREEWFGPLFYRELNENALTIGVPPLFSVERDDSIEKLQWDFLYPLIGYDRFGDEYSLHFFQIFSFSGGRGMEDEIRSRFTIFPFYFHQRSTNPEQNYTAVFPFYGTLKNRLFWDEVDVVMFPIYSRTLKKGVETKSYFVPFFHIREGPSLSGWQLWPIYGYEFKMPHTITNRYDDEEVVPGHQKAFILWPIYLYSQRGVGTTNEVINRALLPLFSYEKSEYRESFTVPWPLGLTITDDRARRYKEIGAPWPFIVIARGEGKNTTRFFPIYGTAASDTLESEFYLWPVYKYNRLNSPPVEQQRVRILLFAYSDTVTLNTDTKNSSRSTSLWPVFIHRIDQDGKQRLQSPALLEPFLPANRAVARNYSPLWGLVREEHNPKENKHSKSFLWNLLREDRNGEKSKDSFLFGLFQVEKDGSSKRVKLFHIPVSNKKQENNEGDKKPQDKAEKIK